MDMEHIDTGKYGLWCCWLAIPVMLVLALIGLVTLYKLVVGA